MASLLCRVAATAVQLARINHTVATRTATAARLGLTSRTRGSQDATTALRERTRTVQGGVTAAAVLLVVTAAAVASIDRLVLAHAAPGTIVQLEVRGAHSMPVVVTSTTAQRAPGRERRCRLVTIRTAVVQQLVTPRPSAQ